MKHLDTFEIADFVTGKSDRKQALKARRHMDDCPDCSMRVKAHHYIRNHFDDVWEAWTSRKRPDDLIVERVERALSRGLEIEVEPSLVKKMEAWLKRIRRSAGIAGCASVRSAARAVDVIRDQLEELVPTAGYVAQPLVLETAILTSGAVVQTGGPKVLRTRGATKTKSAISVETFRTRGSQSIRVKSSPLEKPWPLVMLVPEKGGEPVLGQFSGTDEGLVAEFKGLPKADYLVVVEGRKSKKAAPPKPRTRQRKRPEKKS